MIELLHEDNRAVMARCQDKHFDLAIVDPPYGIGESSKNHASRDTPVKQKNGKTLKAPPTTYTRKNWDSAPPDSAYFRELERVSKRQIIWGANYFEIFGHLPFSTPRRTVVEEFIATHPYNWLLWDKCNGGSDFNDYELAYLNLGYPVPTQVFAFMWNGMMQGKSITEGHIQQGNKALNERRVHPTQKPVQLYRWLLKTFARHGDKILDTHLGSGSIALACHDLGFDLVATEIDKDYYDTAIQRLQTEQMQIRLF